MTIEGSKFYIPTKNKKIILISNFYRSDEIIQEDNVIGVDELNKSDYLFETMILFIIRKIKNSNNKDSEKLYRLIKKIEKLKTEIFLLEIRNFDIILENFNYQKISEISIDSSSHLIAQECIYESIFDYDE